MPLLLMALPEKNHSEALVGSWEVLSKPGVQQWFGFVSVLLFGLRCHFWFYLTVSYFMALPPQPQHWFDSLWPRFCDHVTFFSSYSLCVWLVHLLLWQILSQRVLWSVRANKTLVLEVSGLTARATVRAELHRQTKTDVWPTSDSSYESVNRTIWIFLHPTRDTFFRCFSKGPQSERSRSWSAMMSLCPNTGMDQIKCKQWRKQTCRHRWRS